MTRPRWLLDVDGVSADWLTPALEVVAQETGRQYAYDSFDSWHIEATFERDGLDASRLFSLIYAHVDIRTLPLLPGARKAVEALAAMGDVYFVSAVENVRARGEWLEEHFGHLGLGRRNLVATPAKYVVSGHILVDDHEAHIAAWGKAHPEGAALLFAQPYNRLSSRERYDWAGVLRVASRIAAYMEGP